jgi:acetylornithine/N-succinyldiaminopimelate aminotransferase
MTTPDWKAIEDRYEAPTYARYPVVFTKGNGVHLDDETGKRYVDLYGGHCVSILGHSPTRVIDAVHAQALELPFYSNVVYHPSRARAAQALVEMAPDGFDRVFFCNSGTEANENAIKLAWMHTGKTHMLSTTGGWHGRTLASISVTHTDKMRSPVAFALPDVTFVEFGNLASLEAALSSRDDVAGLIMEPIQSISGCVMADPAYYRGVRELCDRHGVVLIFDEIQTGVGRTGRFSISEWFDMRPDLITLAKSLGAGFPIGAVLMPERIATGLKIGDLGSTFAGGMMAMAACEATLAEIRNGDLMSRAGEIHRTLAAHLRGAPVALRGMGALIGIVLPKPAKEVTGELFKRGWITGTSDDPRVMRLMPPLITPPALLIEFAAELTDILR